MHRLKQGMKIIIMFVLLLAVVGAPLFYTEYQNRHMINEIILSPMQPIHTNGENETEKDYNIWERIGIVNQSVKVRSSVLSNFKNEDIANQAVTEIAKTMEKQLTTLCEYNVLPDLTLSDVIQVSVFKETYTHQTEALRSELSISVWAIEAEYENYHVYAYMDTKLSALYDVTIQAKNHNFIYETDISANGFLEYLMTFSAIPNVQEREELFSANGSYLGQTIVLHLYSVNKETNKFTSYRFRG